jgi:hypothetical protein
LLAFLHLLSIPLAVIYTQLLEWLLHKYVLHGLGKNKNSKWASHWHTHHKKCRKNNNYDDDYKKGWSHEAARQEIVGLVVLSFLHVPMLFISPLFYLTLIFCAIRYYRIHKRSHLDTEWCKTHTPWHYDHHMGKDQDSNWGVTTDWVDRALRTRKRYEDRKASDPFMFIR